MGSTTFEVVNAASLVANLGFPIAAYLLMYRLVKETIRENTRSLAELRASVDSLETAVQLRADQHDRRRYERDERQ